MSVSLPPDIRALMTVKVQWEPIHRGADGSVQPDGYGQWSYDASCPLTCWIEPHTGGLMFGASAYRRIDETVVEPKVDLYFDGDSGRARQIRLWDRFTVPGIGADDTPLQALHVETLYGPPFDNRRPWLIIVIL